LTALLPGFSKPNRTPSRRLHSANLRVRWLELQSRARLWTDVIGSLSNAGSGAKVSSETTSLRRHEAGQNPSSRPLVLIGILSDAKWNDFVFHPELSCSDSLRHERFGAHSAPLRWQPRPFGVTPMIQRLALRVCECESPRRTASVVHRTRRSSRHLPMPRLFGDMDRGTGFFGILGFFGAH
jgi:hypothetical protein